MFQKTLGNVTSDLLDCSELSNNENQNEAIEKVLHKYELEIRAHIKMEKEFKKIAQEAEKKYEEIKDDYNSINKKYEDVIQKLSKFASENEHLTKENGELKEFFAEITNWEKSQTVKSKKKGTKSIDKTKQALHYNPSNYIKVGNTNKKV